MPVYEKGDPNMYTNYKPISLLSPFSKILEKLIFVSISSYFEKYDMLSEQQFCLRKNMSTTQTIRSIYERTTKNINCSLYTCCAFLDLTKALDSVNNAILLHILEFVNYHCNYLKTTYQIDINIQKSITINPDCYRYPVEPFMDPS